LEYTGFVHHKDMQLNSAQEKAIKATEGPVMVLAGPGTGKTTVLVHRILYLLEQGIAPEEILALTFTEAAAHEMQARIEKTAGEKGKRVQIFTFHGLCNSLIEKYPEKFKLAKNHLTITDVDRYQIVHAALDSMNPQFLVTKRSRDRYFYVREIVKKIATLKKEGINKEKFDASLKEQVPAIKAKEKEIEAQEKPTKTAQAELQKMRERLGKLKELWQVYEYYQSELAARNAVDYEDMIRLVLDEFRQDSAWRQKIAQTYRYILVDEYQDTNNAQNEIVFKLALEMKKPNLFVVGDDDQSIYRFQGASTKNLIDFASLFPNFKMIVLTENNRSTKPILELAEAIIKQNSQRADKISSLKKYRINKKLKATNPFLKDKSFLPQFVTTENRLTELNFLVSEIQKLLKKGIAKNEIAILSRTNKEAAEIAYHLARFGIPYLMGWKEDILKDSVVVKFLAALTALLKPEDRESFFIFLTSPVFGLSLLEVAEISHKTRREDSLLKTIAQWESTKPKLKKVISLYQKLLKIVQNQDPLKAWDAIGKELGLKRNLPKEKKEEHQTNVRSMKNQLKEFMKRNQGATLKDFLEYIELAEKYQVSLESEKSYKKDAVNVLTAHGSKGKEFRAVFVTNVNSSAWETRTSPRDNIKLPENLILDQPPTKQNKTQYRDWVSNQFNDECRLLFVALTRAKERLYLTHAQTAEGNALEPSIFIVNAVEANTPLKTLHFLSKDFSNLKESAASGENQQKITQAVIELARRHVFSASSLNKYLACHQEFKYRYLYNIPEPENTAQIFGSAVHKALHKFFLQAQKNMRLPSAKDLLEIFERALPADKFASLEEFEERLTFGKEMLAYFYNYIRRQPFPFIYRLEAWAGETKIGEDIKIKGKIDRIDKIPGKGLRLIDYKTGRRHTEGEVRGTTKNSSGELIKQLQFYKLLYETKYKEEIKEGELIFLEEPEKKMIFPFSQDDLYQIQSQIWQAQKEMLRGHFEPLSSNRKPCSNNITASRLARAGL